MIKNNMVLAFKVDVFHTYFENSICTCLEFSIGNVTKNILKRFDCKISNRINGFDFYINSNNDLPVFFDYIKKTINEMFFDFQIKSNNEDFFFFTDFPTDWVGQVTYCSQGDSNLLENNIVQLTETLAEKRSTTNLGKMVIYFDDILKCKNEKDCGNFEIYFNARATQWQYYIVNKNRALFNHPAIVGKLDIKFEGPENVIIETGEQCMLFSSGSQLIPLSEKHVYRFDLVNKVKVIIDKSGKKIFTPKVVFKGLPNPDPKSMKKTLGNINNIISPMYIYIQTNKNK